MPYCEDCGKWEPTPKPFETALHEWLRVAFHSVNCPARLYIDQEGFLDGYIFQGEILYEVQAGGKWVAVSSFHQFPKPLDGLADKGRLPHVPTELENLNPEGEATQPERPETGDSKRIALEAYSWEEWCAKYPAYSRNAERKVNDAHDPYKGHNPHQGHNQTHYTYGQNYSTYKPDPKWFDEIDKKKWPNTWKWSLRFYFAPDFSRNTRFKYIAPTNTNKTFSD